MPRHTSTAKGGYYPFDDASLPLIASYFRPAEEGRLLDPCAGEGRALAHLATAWGLTPYANELDHCRAETCIEHFGPERAVQGDMFTLRASHAAFSALWCNPLYGDDITGEETRREFDALKHAWKWVQEGGFVFWVVYLHHVTPKAAEWLSRRTKHVRLLALDGLHLGAYKQVILIAQVGRPDDPEAIFNALRNQIASPEPLALQAEPLYAFPQPLEVKNFMFIPERITADMALRLIKQASAHHRTGFQELLTAPPPPPPIAPAVTPRGQQMGMVLASGLFNGMTLDTEELGHCAIRSTTESIETLVSSETSEDEEGTDREVYQTKPITTITLLNAEGRLQQLEGDAPLVDFIHQHRPALLDWLQRNLKPVYDFDLGELGPQLDAIRIKGHRLYPAQKHVIAACHRVLQNQKAVILVGEMGVGKSIVGAALLTSLKPQMKPGQVGLIMAPSHLVGKWQDEMRFAAPSAAITELIRVADVRAFMQRAEQHPNTLHVGIFSKEMAKLNEGHTVACHWRRRHIIRWPRHQPRPEGFEGQRIETIRIPTCPVCGTTITQGDDARPASKAWLQSSKRHCPNCRSRLWQDDRSFSAPKADKGEKYPRRDPRMALADYIALRYPDRVYAFVCDEIHETKDTSTGQGQAMITLAQTAEKTIGLTGTIFGGVASSLFGIEFALNPRTHKRYPWRGGKAKWIAHMGALERVIEHKPTYDSRTGAYTGKRTYQKEATEIPACSPLLVREILDHAVFISLKDLGKALPPYEEIPYSVGMTPVMAAHYERAEQEMKSYLIHQRMQGDISFMSTYLQTLLSWPDTAYTDRDVIHRYRYDRQDRSKVMLTPVTKLPGLNPFDVFPKERALLNLVRDELSQNRKVAVFLRQTGDSGLQERLERLVRDTIPLARTYILHASVEPKRRAQVLQTQVQKGTNVLLCNPELVKTGLDLVDFPTLIFYEISYSLYTTAQASRRAWRLIQDQPCKTYYLYYGETMEERAVELIARKQMAAALLTGEVTGGGLTELSGSNNLFAELAATIGNDAQVTDLRALFAHVATQDTPLSESAWAAGSECDRSSDPGETHSPSDVIHVIQTQPHHMDHLDPDILADPVVKAAIAEGATASLEQTPLLPDLDEAPPRKPRSAQPVRVEPGVQLSLF